MFVGRHNEFEQLLDLKSKNKSQFVVCTGRRRIGKSTLIHYAGKNYKNFIHLQGLAPAKGLKNKDQINYFIKQFSEQTKYPVGEIKDWHTAFRTVAHYSENKEILVFIDEISWLAKYDAKFPSLLKVAWDNDFSKQKSTVLIVCGSVSSWIEDNILNSTHFVGRISKHFSLNELSLSESNQFWGRKKLITSHEKFRYLCISGGVPRYLEEISKSQTSDQLITELCFQKEGFLFNEFERIFTDTFGSKTDAYLSIIESIQTDKKTFSEICAHLKIKPNGKISKLIHHLEISGFIQGFPQWNLDSKKESKIIYYKISDNYMRFYLNCIKPMKRKISSDLIKKINIDDIPQIDSVFGRSFENLMYKNIYAICEKLKINTKNIINWGPYFQPQTIRQKSCQIDLLIQTKNCLYLIEFKFRRKIGTEVIEQVKNQVDKLKFNKKIYSLRTALIYCGELSSENQITDFFDNCIEAGSFLRND